MRCSRLPKARGWTMILLVINNEGRRRPSDIFFKIKNLEHLLLFSIPKTANFEQSENKTASGPCPYIWGAWPLACTYSDCGRLAVPGYRIIRLEVVPLLILYCNSRKLFHSYPSFSSIFPNIAFAVRLLTRRFFVHLQAVIVIHNYI